MVGVPGRSKGCHRCRRRRVKCDESRPNCQRCLKAGISCGGYERQQIWRHTSAASFPAEVDEKEIGKKVAQATTTATTKTPSTDLVPVGGLPPPAELHLAAFRNDFYWSALFSNFVWRAHGGSWLEQAVAGQQGDLSLSAVQALGQSHFGRLHGVGEISRAGMAGYGACLTRLAEQLGQSQQDSHGGSAATGRDLLIPILLVLVQASSSADIEGSTAHLRGLETLLHIWGPEEFQEEPYISAFESARASMTVAGLVSRQRLFLESNAWRTIPWARCPSSKTPQSQLMDILVMVPGLLEEQWLLETAQVMESNNNIKTMHGPLLSRVQDQLVNLFTWRWCWQTTTGYRVLRPHAKMRQLRFNRFATAVEIMLYNAVLIWLLSLLRPLQRDPGALRQIVIHCAVVAKTRAEMQASPGLGDKIGLGPGLGDDAAACPFHLPGAASDMRSAAREILQVFDWVSRHHSWRDGPVFMYLFPVGVAMSVFGGGEMADPHSIAWARRLLASHPVTAGYGGTNDATSGFGFYIRPNSLHPSVVHATEMAFSRMTLAETITTSKE